MSEPVDTTAVVHDAAKRAEYMAERGWCDDDIAPLLRALQSALTTAQREIADLRNRLNLSEKRQGRFPVDAVQPDQKAAEAVRIIGYRHDIQEPGRDPLLMFSQTPANPWSHWLARHLDTCQYTCVPLVAASALTTAQQELAAANARIAELEHQLAVRSVS